MTAQPKPTDTDDLPSDVGLASAEDAQRLRLLGAVMFTAGGTVSEEDLATRLPGTAVSDIPGLMDHLGLRLAAVGLSVRRGGKGWNLVTAPDLSGSLQDRRDRTREVGPAALETLSVIAHEQPCTRADIARMRGTEVGSETMAALQSAGWVSVKGGRKGPGGASLWMTTESFLQDFGLKDLGDLERTPLG